MTPDFSLRKVLWIQAWGASLEVRNSKHQHEYLNKAAHPMIMCVAYLL